MLKRYCKEGKGNKPTQSFPRFFVCFDEETNFGKAVFTFSLPSELYNLTFQQLSSARILVSEAMTRAIAVPQGLFQRSSVTLTVIND